MVSAGQARADPRERVRDRADARRFRASESARPAPAAPASRTRSAVHARPLSACRTLALRRTAPRRPTSAERAAAARSAPPRRWSSRGECLRVDAEGSVGKTPSTRTPRRCGARPLAAAARGSRRARHARSSAHPLRHHRHVDQDLRRPSLPVVVDTTSVRRPGLQGPWRASRRDESTKGSAAPCNDATSSLARGPGSYAGPSPTRCLQIERCSTPPPRPGAHGVAPLARPREGAHQRALIRQRCSACV